MPNLLSLFMRLCFTVIISTAGLGIAYAGFFDGKSNALGQQNDGPLPVEEAFIFIPEIGNNGKVVLRWDIPDRYYLYRDRITVTPSDQIEVLSRINGVTETKDDPLFGSVEVYHQQAAVTLQLKSVLNQPSDGSLSISYQGCWEGGICYPPVTTTLAVSQIPHDVEATVPPAEITPSAVGATANAIQQPVVSEQDHFAEILAGGSLLLTLGAFFLGGLALSLTPCVFPMIPIISSIIAGHGHRITTGRALFLSAVYVLSVSVTYTIAGVLAGLFGENLQAAFQNPWIIGFFSLIFVALALSMFGFYDLQLPNSWQTRLNKASNHQKGGTVTGVAIMGLLSALIVGPCMAAPLAGALIYIGQSGDPLLGGLALFSLSLGMGVPILLVGASAGKLLPKAGVWMDAIKAGFGVLLILMAIWMLDRVVSVQVTMLLTSIVLIISAIYMRAIDPIPAQAKGWHKLWKGVGIIALLYGAALLVGLLSGGKSILYPLKGLTGNSANASQSSEMSFIKVTSLAALEPVLEQAKRVGQPVMLDFYADWCISCIELEHVTFADEGVKQALSGFARVKVDVTANDEASKALNKAYKVIGPPALIFYDKQGQLRPDLTLVGVIDPDDFLNHLTRLDGS